MNSAKTIQRFASHTEQKAEVNRYWASRTPGERLVAVWEATAAAYAFKGIPYDPTRRSPATPTRVQRTPARPQNLPGQKNPNFRGMLF